MNREIDQVLCTQIHKEYPMRKKGGEPRLIEHKEQFVAELQSTSPAPVVKAKVASSKDIESGEAQVRELAFRLYEERGCREGHELEDWLEAEAIISNGKKIA